MSKEAIEFPLDIYCEIKSVDVDIDEDIHIIISKKNKRIVPHIVKILRKLIGRQSYIRVDEGLWDK